MGILCQCGQWIDSTTGGATLRIAQYDTEGRLVFGICQHGITVVDKREKPKEPGK